MLNAEQMRTLPDLFKDIPDPRTKAGRRHSLPTVLALAAGATLCGMRGYKAITQWVHALGQPALSRFNCRGVLQGRKRVRVPPSRNVIRNCLMRVDPDAFNHALSQWEHLWLKKPDRAIAIDGKSMKNAIDEKGRAAHILSAVGHDSGRTHTQKK